MAQIGAGTRARIRLAAWLIALVVAPCFFLQFSLRADTSLEAAVKANYLLKFTNFIEWPGPALGAPGSAFNFCVLGDDPLADTLSQVVRGEIVFGRRAAVQKLSREPGPGACQLLYLGAHERPRRALDRGVLTVGEGEAFVHRGGMIGFVADGGRVTFVINWRVADSCGLRVSSRLLSVAKSVIRK